MKNPSIDTFYSDQKYMLAFKLSAFDRLKDNPLRFVEIHTGYYARGYSSEEFGVEKQRNGFLAIGVNLAEVFGTGVPRASRTKKLFNFFFEHAQLPKTSLEAPVL